jgi:hypothetical protein
MVAPKAQCPQSRNDFFLRTTGVAANENAAVCTVADGKAGLTVLVGGTARHPGAAGLQAAEGPRNRGGAHGRSPARRCVGSAKVRTPEPATMM